MEKFSNNLYVNKSLLKKILILLKFQKLDGKEKIIFEKFLKIPNLLNNHSFLIFKGNKFRFLRINRFLFRMRFGNFIFTRKPFKFISKSKTATKNVKR